MNHSNNPIYTNDIIFNYYKQDENYKTEGEVQSHEYFELILFLGGDFTYQVNGKTYTLNKYDLVLTPPNVKHVLTCGSNSKYERYNIAFHPSLIEGIDFEEITSAFDIINVGYSEVILNIFNKLDFYCSHLNINDFISVAYCLIKELFFNIKIIKNERVYGESKISNLIQNALNMINNDLFKINSIGEIASKLFVSETYLYKIFKKELKATPKQYINEKKLLAAQNMILLGRKPTYVYKICGFTDYSSFYRNYLKYFGTPPSNNGSEQ